MGIHSCPAKTPDTVIEENDGEKYCEDGEKRLEDEGKTLDDLVTYGGPRALATIIGGFASTTATFGYINAFGVYQDIYTRSDATSPSTISWIGSTQLFLLLAVGLPAGKLVDMGYFRLVNLVGSVIFTLSIFMLSLAHQDKFYQLYLSQGIGMGIGAGMLYVPAVAVQANHWRNHRTLVMSIVVTGCSVGGIIFTIMLNQLFKGSVGFAWGVRASAFVVLGLLVVSNVLMTENPSLKKKGKPQADFKVILKDTPFMISAVGTFLIGWGLFYPYFYLQLFAILHGIDPNIAFYSLAVMNASAMIGRIVPNYFAEKYGPFNVFVPSALACCVLIFAMFGIKSVAGTIIFAILYGFFSGSFLALCAPTVASATGDSSEVGVRLGVVFFATAFGTLTGAPIDGALLNNTFEWFKAIIFSGISVLASAVLFTVSRHLISKQKGTQYV